MALTETGKQILSYIERVEKLLEEKKAIQDDIKDVLAEANGNGFDKKVIQALVKLRAKPKHQADEEETLLHTYMVAIGMIPSE